MFHPAVNVALQDYGRAAQCWLLPSLYPVFLEKLFDNIKFDTSAFWKEVRMEQNNAPNLKDCPILLQWEKVHS